LRDVPLWTAMALVWSAAIIQPSTAAVFAVFFAAYGIAVAWARARERQPFPRSLALAIGGGGALAAASWLFLVGTHGWRAFRESLVITSGMFTPGGNADTSGGRIYGLRDFFLPPPLTKIDQAAGLGVVACALALAGAVWVVLRGRRLPAAARAGGVTMLIWLAVSLMGVEGNALPVKLFPHRFWVFLAIPVAALCAEAVFAAAEAWKNRRGQVAIAAALVGAVALTSYGPRVEGQQSVWRPGVGWIGDGEMAACVQLKALPPQTRSFSLCGAQDHLIGMNQDSEPWSPGLLELQRNLATLDAAGLEAFMRRERYAYVVIDERCLRIGRQRLLDLQQSLLASGAFEAFANPPGVLVLRLRSGR
jgi:hypothetical protein